MLTIRSDQVAALAEAPLVNRLIDHYHHNRCFPLRNLHRTVVADMVRVALRRARRYGIYDQRALAAFVALMFAVAPNFDQHPAVRAILRDSQSGADRAVLLLLARLSPDEWNDVRRSYDESAWMEAST
jgi:hypothetical protein